MKLNLLLIIFLFTALQTFAQIKGTVISDKNEALSFVNIYLENTYTGTTSNDEGSYELLISKPDTYVVVFQSLGYKTLKKPIQIDSFPFKLDVALEEERVALEEVVVYAEENPANAIIRKAIEYRKKNLSKYDEFKADFYSRGLIRIKNAPEKILGRDIGDLGGGLDSTRSGIIYLSETISKIDFKKPDKLKEKIIASKVSGDDSGFSFNNANDVNFNFYNNTIEIENKLISPIADYAFNYYSYLLEGDFYDDNGNLINKIRVIPKRENDRVFSGYIYIVEDQWSLYAIDLMITGEQVKIPAADSIKLKQSFSYSKTDKLWALRTQSIDFSYGIFGIEGDGKFTAVYSNYNFNPEFTRRSFSRELLSFEENANQKDSIYWSAIRPVPLSQEEISDYLKKDSIQVIRKSKKYLDSIDKKQNKFKLSNLFTGYTYSKSYKDWSIGISPPAFLFTFNSVQGQNINVNFNFRKNFDEYRSYFITELNTNYGFADERFRINGSIKYKFNNISRPYLTFSGGSKVEQFNPARPISPRVNSISSVFFEDNYMKLFEKYFAEIDFAEELFNGFRLYTNLSFERRMPLFNTTYWSLVDEDDDAFTSNNPLDETAYNIAPFEAHNIFRFTLRSRIRFGQTYFSYPRSKSLIVNNKYPTLYLTYRKGFGSSIQDYHFNHIQARLIQSFEIGNKGEFDYNLKAGTFFNSTDAAFMDYHHFNGNQTHVGSINYLNRFNNLPYYTMSTNESYGEMHFEHNFRGYFMNKIPLLNKLNFNLVLGGHALSVKNKKPYQELTIGLSNIGWGKFRIFRVDYLRSYQSGFLSDILVFGIDL